MTAGAARWEREGGAGNSGTPFSGASPEGSGPLCWGHPQRPVLGGAASPQPPSLGSGLKQMFELTQRPALPHRPLAALQVPKELARSGRGAEAGSEQAELAAAAAVTFAPAPRGPARVWKQSSRVY